MSVGKGADVRNSHRYEVTSHCKKILMV